MTAVFCLGDPLRLDASARCSGTAKLRLPRTPMVHPRRGPESDTRHGAALLRRCASQNPSMRTIARPLLGAPTGHNVAVSLHGPRNPTQAAVRPKVTL